MDLRTIQLQGFPVTFLFVNSVDCRTDHSWLYIPNNRHAFWAWSVFSSITWIYSITWLVKLVAFSPRSTTGFETPLGERCGEGRGSRDRTRRQGRHWRYLWAYGYAEAKWDTNPEDHRQNEGFVSTKTVLPIRFISKVWVSQFTVRNSGRRSVRFRSDTFKSQKNPKKTEVHVWLWYHQEAAVTKQKKLRMNGFFYQSNGVFFFFRDKPLIETIMTSDPCQLKLAIEGSERSSRHNLGSIDSDLEPMKQWTPATAMPSNDNFRTCIICKHITPIDTCWPILSNFEQLWAVFSGQFGSFWAILSIFVRQVWVIVNGQMGI